MSRGFNRSSNVCMTHNAGVVSGVPFTMAGWMYPIENSEILYTMMGLGDSGSSNNYFRFTWRPGTPNVRAVSVSSAGSSGALTTAGPTVNAWNHAAAVFAATDSTAVYLNGGNKGTDDRSCTPIGINRTAIGANVQQSGYDWFEFDGRLAEFAIWNIDLTDGEIAVLAGGFSPLFVRPENLVAYWPLVRKGSVIDGMDIVGKFNMTDVNDPSNEPHCRIFNPGHGFYGVTVPEINIAAIMMYYKKMRT